MPMAALPAETAGCAAALPALAGLVVGFTVLLAQVPHCVNCSGMAAMHVCVHMLSQAVIFCCLALCSMWCADIAWPANACNPLD